MTNKTREIPMPVFFHRNQPGLKNGEDVDFNVGEVVKYKTRDGKKYTITIDSERMVNGEYYGYEAIFPDGRFFAVNKGIYDWEGKA